MNLPESMLHVIRQRLDLDKCDSSMDQVIEKMQPLEIVRHMAGWHLGDPDWADEFAVWFGAAASK